MMDTAVVTALVVLGAFALIAIVVAVVSAVTVSSLESRVGEGENE